MIDLSTTACPVFLSSAFPLSNAFLHKMPSLFLERGRCMMVKGWKGAIRCFARKIERERERERGLNAFCSKNWSDSDFLVLVAGRNGPYRNTFIYVLFYIFFYLYFFPFLLIASSFPSIFLRPRFVWHYLNRYSQSSTICFFFFLPSFSLSYFISLLFAPNSPLPAFSVHSTTADAPQSRPRGFSKPDAYHP